MSSIQSTDPTNRISDKAHDVAESSKEFVGNHPLPTTMSAFAAGLGAGLALVYLVSGGSRHRHEMGVAHKLGRQVLDSISNAVPDSLKFGR